MSKGSHVTFDIVTGGVTCLRCEAVMQVTPVNEGGSIREVLDAWETMRKAHRAKCPPKEVADADDHPQVGR